MDESYFGARRGRGAAGKTPVFGLLKRGGKVFTTIVPNCSREELMPVIQGKILAASYLLTAVVAGGKYFKMHVLVIIPVAAAAYFAALFILKFDIIKIFKRR